MVIFIKRKDGSHLYSISVTGFKLLKKYKMEAKEDLIKIYTGVELSVILLKARLEEIGISSLVKNDFSDAWLGAAPTMSTLYIEKSDFEKAEPFVRDFINTNNE